MKAIRLLARIRSRRRFSQVGSGVIQTVLDVSDESQRRIRHDTVTFRFRITLRNVAIRVAFLIRFGSAGIPQITQNYAHVCIPSEMCIGRFRKVIMP